MKRVLLAVIILPPVQRWRSKDLLIIFSPMYVMGIIMHSPCSAESNMRHKEAGVRQIKWESSIVATSNTGGTGSTLGADVIITNDYSKQKKHTVRRGKYCCKSRAAVATVDHVGERAKSAARLLTLWRLLNDTYRWPIRVFWRHRGRHWLRQEGWSCGCSRITWICILKLEWR